MIRNFDIRKVLAEIDLSEKITENNGEKFKGASNHRRGSRVYRRWNVKNVAMMKKCPYTLTIDFIPKNYNLQNLKNSCNISLTTAGFSAKGACPASSTISRCALLILSLNTFECSIGIKLSFLPHIINVGTSRVLSNLSSPICVVVLLRKADSKACFAPGLLILFMKISTNIGKTLQG
jgi:hypothetical protein